MYTTTVTLIGQTYDEFRKFAPSLVVRVMHGSFVSHPAYFDRKKLAHALVPRRSTPTQKKLFDALGAPDKSYASIPGSDHVAHALTLPKVAWARHVRDFLDGEA